MRLKKLYAEKIWGLETLPPPFTSVRDKRIGEIWFEPPEALPEILVKYIFANEKLSVQCHPSDVQTLAAGLGKQGKEECWLVVAADEGAQLAVGFTEDIDAQTMRTAAIDGSIESFLAWHDVEVGDFFYIPANTVHAIGPGVTIVEIQQNSDITYRLYDYGRPRELHLDDGIRVASGKRFDPSTRRRVPPALTTTLVHGPHFRLDQVAGGLSDEQHAAYPGKVLIIPRAGEIEVAGESLEPGECALASGLDEVNFHANAVGLIAAVHPD